MLETVFQLALVSGVVAASATTFSKTAITAPLRLFIFHALGKNELVAHGLVCSYCMSHWFALIFYSFIPPVFTQFDAWYELPVIFIFKIMLVVFVSAAMTRLAWRNEK